jgi:hypothetical protein
VEDGIVSTIVKCLGRPVTVRDVQAFHFLVEEVYPKLSRKAIKQYFDGLKARLEHV